MAPAGAARLRAPRVGLYKPWLASMDEGWTRFLLERYGFAPVALDNAGLRAGKLGTRFDVIVLPDVEKEVLAGGKPKRDEGEMRYFPEPRPEYAGGLGKEGAAALREFVEGGGTLVALASSSEYLIDELALPVRNALAHVPSSEFLCPGGLVRIELGPAHPVTFGLPESLPAFLDGPLAFDNAVSIVAAKTKGIQSAVAGQAEILVVPDLESGNMVAKQLEYLANALTAGIVLGTKVPIVLTSRADTAETRTASCVIAALIAHAKRAKENA